MDNVNEAHHGQHNEFLLSQKLSKIQVKKNNSCKTLKSGHQKQKQKIVVIPRQSQLILANDLKKTESISPANNLKQKSPSVERMLIGISSPLNMHLLTKKSIQKPKDREIKTDKTKLLANKKTISEQSGLMASKRESAKVEEKAEDKKQRLRERSGSRKLSIHTPKPGEFFKVGKNNTMDFRLCKANDLRLIEDEIRKGEDMTKRSFRRAAIEAGKVMKTDKKLKNSEDKTPKHARPSEANQSKKVLIEKLNRKIHEEIGEKADILEKLKKLKKAKPKHKIKLLKEKTVLSKSMRKKKKKNSELAQIKFSTTPKFIKNFEITKKIKENNAAVTIQRWFKSLQKRSIESSKYEEIDSYHSAGIKTERDEWVNFLDSKYLGTTSAFVEEFKAQILKNMIEIKKPNCESENLESSKNQEESLGLASDSSEGDLIFEKPNEQKDWNQKKRISVPKLSFSLLKNEELSFDEDDRSESIKAGNLQKIDYQSFSSDFSESFESLQLAEYKNLEHSKRIVNIKSLDLKKVKRELDSDEEDDENLSGYHNIHVEHKPKGFMAEKNFEQADLRNVKGSEEQKKQSKLEKKKNDADVVFDIAKETSIPAKKNGKEIKGVNSADNEISIPMLKNEKETKGMNSVDKEHEIKQVKNEGSQKTKMNLDSQEKSVGKYSTLNGDQSEYQKFIKGIENKAEKHGWNKGKDLIYGDEDIGINKKISDLGAKRSEWKEEITDEQTKQENILEAKKKDQTETHIKMLETRDLVKFDKEKFNENKEKSLDIKFKQSLNKEQCTEFKERSSEVIVKSPENKEKHSEYNEKFSETRERLSQIKEKLLEIKENTPELKLKSTKTQEDKNKQIKIKKPSPDNSPKTLLKPRNEPFHTTKNTEPENKMPSPDNSPKILLKLSKDSFASPKPTQPESKIKLPSPDDSPNILLKLTKDPFPSTKNAPNHNHPQHSFLEELISPILSSTDTFFLASEPVKPIKILAPKLETLKFPSIEEIDKSFSSSYDINQTSILMPTDLISPDFTDRSKKSDDRKSISPIKPSPKQSPRISPRESPRQIDPNTYFSTVQIPKPEQNENKKIFTSKLFENNGELLSDRTKKFNEQSKMILKAFERSETKIAVTDSDEIPAKTEKPNEKLSDTPNSTKSLLVTSEKSTDISELKLIKSPRKPETDPKLETRKPEITLKPLTTTQPKSELFRSFNPLSLDQSSSEDEESTSNFSTPQSYFCEDPSELISKIVSSEIYTFLRIIPFKDTEREVDGSLDFIIEYLEVMAKELKINEEEVLDAINTPAYQEPVQKLALIQDFNSILNKFPTLELVLPPDLCSELKVFFQSLEIPSRQIYLQMLFDCVNEALNYIRPFGVEGIPDPWSSKPRILFGEAELSNVFSRIISFMVKWASCRTGTFHCPESRNDEDRLALIREEKMSSLLCIDVKDEEIGWLKYEEEETQIRILVANSIFGTLLDEMLKIINN